MKVVICLAVLAALVEVSQANTCWGVTDCVNLLSKAASERTEEEVCRGMLASLDCMDRSIGDCENLGMDQSMIDTYQSQLKSVRAPIDERCGSAGSSDITGNENKESKSEEEEEEEEAYGAGTVAKMSITALLISAIVVIAV